MRQSKHGLGDLKRLRVKAETVPDQPAQAPRRPHPKRKFMAPADVRQPEPANPPAQARASTSASIPTSRTGAQSASPPLQPNTVLSAQDKALFRQAVKSVQAIKDTHRAILPPVPTANAVVLRQRRETAIGLDPIKRQQVSDHYRPAPSEQDDTRFTRHGYGPDLAKNLKRGKWPVGATLDLHGDTLDQARERLDRFLQSCVTHHVKSVRIVHGKGYGSKDGEPVLRQTIRRWLTQMSEVLAYVECAEPEGGSGAVQVLLRDGTDD